MDIKTIVEQNLNRTLILLGHLPGPGIDITINPTLPVSSSWDLKPLTPCGAAFLAKYFPEKTISTEELRTFKKDLADWGLSSHTDWSNVVNERIDR